MQNGNATGADCKDLKLMMRNMTALGIPNNLPPLSYRELRGYLWFGVAGVLLLTLGVFPDSAVARWVVAGLIAAWFFVPARGMFKRSAPDSQSENSKAMKALIRLYTVVVITFSIVFAFWARALGLSWIIVISALFVIDAFANVIASLTEWWRLSMLGHSLGLMICGFGFPFVDRSRWGLLVGGALLVGSLLASGILYLQVRHQNSSVKNPVNPI